MAEKIPAVNKATEAARNAIRRVSTYSLPNNPSERGMKPDEIKRAFWQPIIGLTQSVILEQDRIVDEINQAVKVLDENRKENSAKIGTGELLVPENIPEGESGLIGLANANKRHLDRIQFDEDARVQAEKARKSAEEERKTSEKARVELYETFKGSIYVINQNARLIVDCDGNGSILYIGMQMYNDGYGNIVFKIEGDEEIFGKISFSDDGEGNVVIGNGCCVITCDCANKLTFMDDNDGNVTLFVETA